MRITGRGVVIASLLLVVALCIGGSFWWALRPGPALTIGAAPANPAKLSIPDPGNSGMVSGSQWPRACALISDDELRAVLPEATDIKRRPSGERFRSGTVPELYDTVVEIPEANCHIELSVPGRRDFESINMDVRVEFVGSRFYAEANYSEHGDKIDLPGADVCHKSTNNYRCRKGGVDFEMSGGITKGVRFAGQQGDPNAYFGTKALVEYVKLILAKLP